MIFYSIFSEFHTIKNMDDKRAPSSENALVVIWGVEPHGA